MNRLISRTRDVCISRRAVCYRTNRQFSDKPISAAQEAFAPAKEKGAKKKKAAKGGSGDDNYEWIDKFVDTAERLKR